MKFPDAAEGGQHLSAGQESPFDRANWFSSYFFCFLQPLIRLASDKSRKVTSSHFIGCQPKRSSAENATPELAQAWQDELQTNSKSPKLVRAIARVYGRSIALAFSVSLLSECIVEILFISFTTALIEDISNFHAINATKLELTTSEESHHFKAMRFCLISDALGLITTLSMLLILVHPYIWSINKIVLEMRSAIATIVFKKSLLVDRFRCSTYRQGLALIAKDMDQLDGNFRRSVWVLTGPIASLLLSLLLAKATNWPVALVCLATNMIFACQRSITNVATKKWLREAAELSDQRSGLSVEAALGIRSLQMCPSTSKTFYQSIVKTREQELAARRHILMCLVHDGLNFFIASSLSVIVTLAFAHYIMEITIDQALVAQVCITAGIMRRTLGRQTPQGVFACMSLGVIFNRVTDYLVAEESSHDVQPLTEEIKTGPLLEVRQVTGTYRWFNEISFELEANQMMLLIGKSGSGKSSLLEALLGELQIKSGSVHMRRDTRIAYASQENWIMAGTIRENILLAEPVDTKRYSEVLRICCLLPDLALLSEHDLTVVGDRGLTLSSGQRARINLARCLYQRADLYLLDEPLSFADFPLSERILKQALDGLLAEKTIILATNQLQFATIATHILLLPNNNRQVPVFGQTLVVQESDQFKALSSTTEFRLDKREKKDLISCIKQYEALEKSNLSTEDIKLKCESMRLSIGNESDVEDIRSLIKPSGFIRGMRHMVRNCSSRKVIIIFVMTSISCQILFIGINTWIGNWTAKQEMDATKITWFSDSTFETSFNQVILVVISMWLCLLLASGFRSSTLFEFLKSSMRNVVGELVEKVLRARMSFFDLHPAGTLINTLSADVSYMDTQFINFVDELSLMLATGFFILSANLLSQPELIIGAAFICYCLKLFFDYALYLAKVIKCQDGIRRSVLYMHINNTLDGLATIRAASKQELFINTFMTLHNKHMSIFFLNLALRRMVVNWIDWACIIFCTILIMIDVRNTLPGHGLYAYIGLNLLVQVLRLNQNVITQFIETFTSLQSITNFGHHSKLENETRRVSRVYLTRDDLCKEVSITEGKIEFSGVSLRYTLDGVTVLKDVTVTIEAGQKVTIVGPTGAGKSSLISVLLRFYHFEGFVQIDGQDTKMVAVESLRDSISVVPEEPVLFTGTLRYNLDPLEEYQDEQLWQALDLVQLREQIASNPDGLNMEVKLGGLNFSIGQRQLVLLAKAILRGKKLLILDNLEANVDSATGQLIRETVRRKFARSTVVTITRCLSRASIEADRLFLMEAGRLIEASSSSGPHQSGHRMADIFKNTDPQLKLKSLDES